METNISTLALFLSKVRPGDKVIYRGHPSSSYKLLPSVSRGWGSNEDALVKMEKVALSRFKQQAVPFIKYRPDHDLEWLVLMQHHGAPTRLLDWTFNPVVALYFAVCSNEDEDGIVYQATYRSQKDISDVNDVFQSKKIFVYTPRHITERIGPQSGCFFVYAEPLTAISSDHKRITRYKIPKKYKRLIRDELSKIGVHESILFPGLDGLCKSLKAYIDQEIEDSIWTF